MYVGGWTRGAEAVGEITLFIPVDCFLNGFVVRCSEGGK